MTDVAIIKYFDDSRHLLFAVPYGTVLAEGDIVLVKTRRGETVGKCVCSSFHVGENPLKALAQKYGATLPLAPVIGICNIERF